MGDLSTGNRVVAASEWSFRTQKFASKKNPLHAEEEAHDAKTLVKQFSSIEQELCSLQKLMHENVVHYEGMSHVCQKTHIKLYVLQEYVHGSNVSFYLSENLPMQLDLLRFVSRSVLSGLDFMHEHNIVHRNLRDTSVFLGQGGAVKVGDFSIDKRVRDLYQASRESEERFPMAIGRGGKKVDIYRLGLLLLSLAQGEIVQDPTVSKGLPSDLTDFLKKCLNRDERERWSCGQLLDHAWSKEPLEKSPLLKMNGSKEIVVNSPAASPRMVKASGIHHGKRPLPRRWRSSISPWATSGWTQTFTAQERSSTT